MGHHHGHHHGHGHGHGHGHHHHSSSTKTLAFATLITLGFAVVEAIAGWYSHSLALLSDAGHMGSDALALLIALLASWLSQQPPSVKHSYGLGRAEVIAATFSSLLMFFIAIGITIEAIGRFSHHHPVNGPVVMLVATIGIVVNFVVAYLLSKGQQTLNIRAALLHVVGDILGSFAALASGAIIYYTGWFACDPILSVIIAVLIAFSSIHLLKEALSVLMEGVPLHLNLQEIRASMCEVSAVNTIHDLHVWTLASGNIALSAHVEIDCMSEWSYILQQLQQRLRDEYSIRHSTLQPEHATTQGCLHCE